jgi:hypothetical protein
MRTTNDLTTTSEAAIRSSYDRATKGSDRWLSRRHRWIIAAAVAVAAIALALGEHWLALVDLLPLLYALPCAAMLFMCMKGMNHSGQSDASQASSRSDRPAASDTRN